MSKVRVMVFPGAHNLPLWLMDGLEIHYTKSRDEQIEAIQEGHIDVIHTSPDNLFLADANGLSPFLSGTVGPLDLVTTQNHLRRDNQSQDDRPQSLQAQILAVDNPNSGFGRLAYRWLREHAPDVQYQILSVGGTPQRFQALKTGQATMAVMHPPFTQFCMDAGYTLLGRIDTGYPTLCGACRVKSMDTDTIRTYKQRYRNVLEQLSGPKGQSIARATFAKNLPDIQGETRDTITDVMRQEVVAAGVQFDIDTMNRLKDLL